MSSENPAGAGNPTLELAFPHDWEAEILDRLPPILPARHFVYPERAEEVERGALNVLVRRASDAPFLGTFALGFSDPAVPGGVWSCPDADALCAIAGGYAYVVDARQPGRFTQIPCRPVLEVRPLPARGLLLFAGHHTLLAWGENGLAWESARLSAEGIRILGIEGDRLHGLGWDLLTDQELPFAVNLRTGETVSYSGR